LIVRKIEDRVVRQLRATAQRLGVSVEEAHRRILRQFLLGESGPPPSFKEYLSAMPDAGDDSLFTRQRTRSQRQIEL
jgi:plasmid stability protein